MSVEQSASSLTVLLSVLRSLIPQVDTFERFD